MIRNSCSRSIRLLLNNNNSYQCRNIRNIVTLSSMNNSRSNLTLNIRNNNNHNVEYQNIRNYCSKLNDNINTDSTTTQQHQQTNNNNKVDETIDEFKALILDGALKNVALYGWSETAISKACTDLGYEPTLHSMFENGGYDLAYYFVTKCNRQLSEKLTPEILSALTQRERVKLAIKMRLSMIAPYINRWAEAMQVLAHPRNIISSAPSMAGLVDEIWHLVDDRSTDFEWYTKRGLLAALYTSSELYMLNDTTPEFVSTWRFVDDRVDDMINVLKFKNDIGQSVSLTANMLLNKLNKK
ncbi:ubiquinone biosynthesis protein [Heterostelium album PN500]|uniref:Ubiquinone biosynthesis protein n=1 Tax=Heterostelium pallidum (strain ATCC 26659 / Pp 5 / PN500) TaxID=670386 RepID=D3BIP8_HETP5|nr:ubiquinone biosynthesis protein [Heterostelium album PN500]EFA78672.1 ubiquinone biosynthesis protein [Heterostelium album PN500]|eukprot:XP_020430796.1 ubiquinone biosynthesis protein [Heterostelium album PN500]